MVPRSYLSWPTKTQSPQIGVKMGEKREVKIFGQKCPHHKLLSPLCSVYTLVFVFVFLIELFIFYYFYDKIELFTMYTFHVFFFFFFLNFKNICLLLFWWLVDYFFFAFLAT